MAVSRYQWMPVDAVGRGVMRSADISDPRPVSTGEQAVARSAGVKPCAQRARRLGALLLNASPLQRHKQPITSDCAVLMLAHCPPLWMYGTQSPASLRAG